MRCNAVGIADGFWTDVRYVLVGVGGFEVGLVGVVDGGLVPMELHADSKSKHVIKVGMMLTVV